MITMPKTWKEYCFDCYLENNSDEDPPVYASQESFVYLGPESSKEAAIKAITDYYDGFNGKYKWSIADPKIKN